MSAVANHLFSATTTAHANDVQYTLYNANADVMGASLTSGFKVEAGGAVVFPEIQDLTAGESTTKLGRIRFVDPSNGHTYGVCTSSRYVGYTTIWGAGNTQDTTNTYAFYDMRFSGNTGNNLRVTLNDYVGNGSYSHGASVYVDGSIWFSVSNGSATNHRLLSRGNHTIRLVLNGDSSHGNSSSGTVYRAQ